jgi:hypothetical protein
LAHGNDAAAQVSLPLEKVCSSAVDPLEIAVGLEVAGISHAVVTERYDRADVFSLARWLWNRVPLQPAPAKLAELPRSGNWQDLVRGLLYALPALMLFALTSTLDLHLARWVLPLAISWGWGLGQVAAFVGYRLQGGQHAQSEAAAIGRVIAGAVASTWVLATSASLTLGGNAAAVVTSTALVTYMVTSAVLLVRAEERWLAVLLLPGAVASPVVLAMPHESSLARWLAVALVGGSFVGVVCRALRHTGLRRHGDRPVLARRDVVMAAGHLVHGVLCGLAVSLLVIRSRHESPDDGFARMLVPMPLLATLGVMEWQLRSFRSRVSAVTRSLDNCGMFPTLAWRQFLRSLTIYATANAVAVVAAVIAVRIHGGNVAADALTLQWLLGAAFLTDVILVLLDRVDLVLRSWSAGLVVGSVAFAGISVLSDNAIEIAVSRAGAVVVAVLLVSLLVCAYKVVSTAMSY